MRVRSSSSARQVRIQRFMIAFIRGTRIPVMIIAMPLSARTASKAALSLLSGSRIRYVTVVWASWRSMTRFLAIGVVQAAVGCGGCAEDVDAAGGVLNDGKDEQSRSGQGAGVEEVGGEQGVGLAAQEGGPAEVVAVGRGRDVVGCEDLPDGAGRDRDSQGGEFAVDSSVAPTGVVAR
jgi:hypothetical protein